MRSPKDFFRPKAIGAPMPPRDIPFRPARMIHFFDPSNPKMAAKVPDLAKKCDVLLGNLEDAVEVGNKEAAREGLVKIGRATDFGDCQLWTRVNSLDSPWPTSRSPCSSMPSSKHTWASRTWRTSAAPRPACRASPSAPRTWRPRVG
jgi:hypothetical protein